MAIDLEFPSLAEGDAIARLQEVDRIIAGLHAVQEGRRRPDVHLGCSPLTHSR